MNVDNVDNVESTWRIKLCATAKKWRNFVYYRKKYEKSTKYYVNQFCIKNPHAIRI